MRMIKKMKMLDLFSGIGGFSLAAQWVWGDELEIVGFCEIDPYCQKVLAKNFPAVPIHNDITKLDGQKILNKLNLDSIELEGKEAAGKIDLITGGFP